MINKHNLCTPVYKNKQKYAHSMICNLKVKYTIKEKIFYMYSKLQNYMYYKTVT